MAFVPLMARPVRIGIRKITNEPGDQALACDKLERVTGIEPALSAWEADVLPLNYTRAQLQLSDVAVTEPGLRCVRPDIVPDPVGCQRAPLRS